MMSQNLTAGYASFSCSTYGTAKDPAEHYQFQREPDVPDDTLTTIYEGNGLFAKIIDTPAEEAIKHGFTLKDVSDKAVEDFVAESLDELDWEELAMTAIRWTRLFGGAIAVMGVQDVEQNASDLTCVYQSLLLDEVEHVQILTLEMTKAVVEATYESSENSDDGSVFGPGELTDDKSKEPIENPVEPEQ